MTQLEELKSKIKEKLPELDLVIGWEQGFDPLRATPLFIRKEEDIERLIWSPLCVQNLAGYLTGLKGKKVGIIVKGCDSRSVIELLQENLINREEVYIFGLSCQGIVDVTKIKRAVGNIGLITKTEVSGGSVKVEAGGKEHTLSQAEVASDKCTRCKYPNALISDEFIGDKVEAKAEDNYADLEAFESQDLDTRLGHWKSVMERCLRCYACRNACPLCVCQDFCVAQSRSPHWLTQSDSVQDKWMFQVIHAVHLAGRCTECGECERACPVDIPLLLIKRKLNKSVKELFDYEAGTNLEARPPLLTFKMEEEKIKEREW